MENLKPVFICWKSIVFISQTERAVEHAPVTDNILRVNVDAPGNGEMDKIISGL